MIFLDIGVVEVGVGPIVEGVVGVLIMEGVMAMLGGAVDGLCPVVVPKWCLVSLNVILLGKTYSPIAQQSIKLI